MQKPKLFGCCNTMCLPSTPHSPFGKFHCYLNFCDILTHSSVVFSSVFKYIFPRIWIIAAATCSTMYKIAFLLIQNWCSNEWKDSPLTKYLTATQHISSGFMHSFITVSFFNKEGTRSSTNFSKDVVFSLT